MRLSVDFSGLKEAVRRMGAPPVDLEIDVRRGIDPVGPIIIEIEVDLGEVTPHPSGVLTYQGEQVVLYIQDQGWRIHDVLADGRHGRKVHVADCDTLRQMRHQGRYERYVATNNVSGDFHVTGQDESGDPVEGKARLRVCKNCLRMLDYRKYRSNREEVFEGFEWSEFFDAYSPYFTQMPTRRAGESDGGYTENWDRIAKEYKQACGFTCEICGVKLREHPRLLHVHHNDGVKTNNDKSNLQALCVDCHGKQPGHNHMHVSTADANLIDRLRRRQSLLPWSQFEM